MSTVQFGALEIGRIPRVVGTLSTFDSLASFATLPDKPCDIAELRLDNVGTNTDWLKQCKSIEATGTPVILTLRSAAEGGKSRLSDNERKVIYESALPVVSAIDVELQSGLPEALYSQC